MEIVWVTLIVFVGCFTQGLSGFGSALVAMPLLSPLLGLRHAAPLLAMVGGTLQIVLLARYHRAFQFRAVWRLLVAAAVGVPLGVYGLRRIDERITLSLLGIIILAYAVFVLTRVTPPKVKHGFWSYVAGFFGGLLGGAYNTSGPPVVLYGDCCRWPPATFKSNLQGFFSLNNAFVLVGHALAGNVTAAVGWSFLFALPAIGAGIVAAALLDRYISHAQFRRIVLVLLVLLGAQLLVRALLGS